MPLSSSNAIQSKAGWVAAQTAPVVLDSPTQAGSTVTIELSGGGLPITDVGANLETGFELDAVCFVQSVRRLFMFRKRDVAAGEGVAGSTPWNFTYSLAAAVNWSWRVTEWDRGLEPVFPLERISTVEASGTGVNSLAIPAPNTPARDDLVGLAYFQWLGGRPLGTPAPSFSWSGHTNGYTERGNQRFQSVGGASNTEVGESWAWKFGTAADAWGVTATVNMIAGERVSGDTFGGLLVLYAATVYA